MSDTTVDRASVELRLSVSQFSVPGLSPAQRWVRVVVAGEVVRGGQASVQRVVDLRFASGERWDGVDLVLRRDAEFQAAGALDDENPGDDQSRRDALVAEFARQDPVGAAGVIAPLLLLDELSGGSVRRCTLSRYASGGDLRQWITASSGVGAPPGDGGVHRGGMGLVRSARLLAPVARSMDVMAARDGLHHRDLTPANVVLREPLYAPVVPPTVNEPEDRELEQFDGVAALVDFGVTKLEAPGLAQWSRRSAGTPTFTPPEIQAGERTYNPDRLAAWQLAVLWCWAACGRAPFAGETDTQIESTASNYAAPDLRRLSPEMREALRHISTRRRQALLRALDASPENRPSLSDVRGLMLEVAKLATASAAGDRPIPSDADVMDQLSRGLRRPRDGLLRRPRRGWSWLAAAGVPWALACAVVAGLLAWRVSEPTTRALVPVVGQTGVDIIAVAACALLAIPLARVAWAGSPPKRMAVVGAAIAVPAASVALVLTQVTDEMTWRVAGLVVVVSALAGAGLFRAVLVRAMRLRCSLAIVLFILLVLAVRVSAGAWFWQQSAITRAGPAAAVAAIVGAAVLVVASFSTVSRRTAVIAAVAAGTVCLPFVVLPAVQGLPGTWGTADVRYGFPATLTRTDDPAPTGDFLRVRPADATGATWSRRWEDTSVGDEFEMEIDVADAVGLQNSATETARAEGVVVRVELPSRRPSDQVVLPVARISWVSPDTELTTTVASRISAEVAQGVRAGFVPGSAVLLVDGEEVPLENSIVEDGVLVGSGGGDGALTAGASCKVRLRVRMERTPGAFVARIWTGDGWGGSSEVENEDLRDVDAKFINQSGLQVQRLVISARLPDGLVLGSSNARVFTTDQYGEWQQTPVSARLTAGGIEVGPIAPGAVAVVRFSVASGSNVGAGLSEIRTAVVRAETAHARFVSVVDVVIVGPPLVE